MQRHVKLWLAVAVVLALVAAGCSSDDSDGSASEPVDDGHDASRRSPGASRCRMPRRSPRRSNRSARSFTKANPNATVTFNPGSSGTLAMQIQQTNGAGIDTFASADEDTMNKLVTANLIDGAPQVFAKNKLIIVTKPGNPKHVKTLADLADLDIVSLCALTAPCGKYAAQILTECRASTIPESKVTRGIDANATLAAVTTGDADAAIVYVTDAKGAGDAVDRRDDPGRPERDRDLSRSRRSPRAATRTPRGPSSTTSCRAGVRRRSTSFGFLPPT